MEAKNKDLWVFIEIGEDKKAHKVGLELLTPGRELAAKQGGELVAVVIGAGCDDAANAAAAYGADKVLVVEGGEYAEYRTDAYATAMATLAEKYGPTTILIGATKDGRDLAPRLAARLETGCAADCTALDYDEAAGSIVWTRPVLSGTQLFKVVCTEKRPQIGTVRPGVFKRGEPNGSGQIVKEDIRVPEDQIRTKVLEFIANEGEKVDLEGAEIIVAGGRGMGSTEGFALLKELASLLGATVGASRAAVDAEWISHVHQVGQTGKTVGPKLYIACGISGAIQHLVGMTGSDCIVAINKDPDAPIFGVADYGIVGNAKEVLPIFIEEVKRIKA